MEAASTSETSVNFYQTTRRNIPEDSNLRFFFHFSNDEIVLKAVKTASYRLLFHITNDRTEKRQ
jgi:hypothetical protein